MRISFNNLKLKEDTNRIEVLHWGHFSFVLLALSLELFHGREFFSWLITAALLVVFYRLFFITKRELFYSFWSFSLFLGIFLIDKILFNSYQFEEVRLLYMIGAILLGIEIYILSSPIYYPRERWWEYDFRYRADITVFVDKEENKLEGRITDLRRGAGCLASFDEFNIGEQYSLSAPEDITGELEFEIVSKRIYSLGRPYNYGIKFLVEKPSVQKSYADLLTVWKNENKQRKEKKFTTQPENS